jgi:hypothetical protein
LFGRNFLLDAQGVELWQSVHPYVIESSQWLMPIIPATQEAEVRRITVQSQPGQIIRETLSQRKKKHKNRASRVAQGVGPEFKPQYHRGQKKKSSTCFIRKNQNKT